MAGGVFISYRREDSAGFARIIYERLASQLKRENVFLDIDNIEAGADFKEVLTNRIGNCDALVAIIGKYWLFRSGQGDRRIDNPDDFVRNEIEAALRLGVRVIPVLVDGAVMPRPEKLPESLKSLTHMQAIEISHAHFEDDVKRLTLAVSSVREDLSRPEHVAPVLAVRDGHETLDFLRAEYARVKREETLRAYARVACDQENGKAANPCYYVSYAWADPTDPSREKDVDLLCEAATKKGIRIIRDKTSLHHGDFISDFMRELGDADRVFVFLSDKYLKSPYCMFELFELWRNSKQNRADFLRHVWVFTTGAVNIDRAADRLKYTEIWKLERDGLRNAINNIGWEEVGEAAIKDYFRMKTFTGQVSDVLAVFADAVQERTVEDFIKYDLA